MACIVVRDGMEYRQMTAEEYAVEQANTEGWLHTADIYIAMNRPLDPNDDYPWYPRAWWLCPMKPTEYVAMFGVAPQVPASEW